MSIVLRDYQLKIVEETRELMRQGCRNILVTAPTGAGKTAIASHMLKTSSDKGNPSWFVCNRIELVKQTMRAFDKIGSQYGVVNANFPMDTRPNLQICSIQTLVNRQKYLKPPRLIFWDEARGIAAKTWDKVFRANPQAFHVGLDATPWRLDGRGMGDYFDNMVKGPEVHWLIEQGFLCPYVAYAPSKVDTSKLHTRMGDYVKAELSSIMDKPKITGNAVDQYIRYANGKRNLVFCVSVEHSQNLAREFQSRGIRAKHIDGAMSHFDRANSLLQFARGELQVLTSVDLVTAGLDIPAIECVQLLRPTQSLSMWIQMTGRGLRTSEGKHQVIFLDHVGGFETHGLPDDERVWSLESQAVSGGAKKSQGPTVRVCSSCFAAQPSGRPTCVSCGNAFEVQGRKIENVDGELKEINADTLRKKKSAEAPDDPFSQENFHRLMGVAKKRRFRNPLGWVKSMQQAQQARKLRGK